MSQESFKTKKNSPNRIFYSSENKKPNLVVSRTPAETNPTPVTTNPSPVIVGGGCTSLHEIVDGQSMSAGETTPVLTPNYHEG